jgi:hypothetical protein
MLVKFGFIDHSEGANIRTLPAEQSGSRCLTSAPLPPGTRVAVLGPHRQNEWCSVTTVHGGHLLRGYVQGFRITTELPEPLATLHSIKPGERLEPIAARIYHQAIEPGRDLRFYENVVLHVNQATGRGGVQRLHGDVRLVAGHRIWLVSTAFARRLQGVVESGSITGGAVARVREARQPLEDILASVTSSPDHLSSVAGEYAEAIQQHLPEIMGIVLAFLGAEALSVFLAATPTGVGQLAAAVIQLGLAAFGVQGLIEAGVEAVRHATEWLTQAWKARGDARQIEAASKSFLRMLLSLALAALAKAGVKSNFNRGLKLAQAVKITPPSLVMVPVAGGGGGAVAVPHFRPGSITSTAAAAVSTNPLTGPAAAASRLPKELPSNQKLANKVLDDAELEKLLEKLPNWEQLKEFVGRYIPEQGTPEFAALKGELRKAGYQLDVIKDGSQPFRLRRLGGPTQGNSAPLTVTEQGMIVLKADGASRISVYSRCRKSYLEWVEQVHGKVARAAAAARVSAGNQLHHLIPDVVAQRHPLVREALKRLKGYTIDRGTNIIDMPTTPNAEGRIVHLGSHPEYNKFVTAEIDRAMRRAGFDTPFSIKPELLHELLLKVEDSLRKAIEGGNLPPKVLKELLEDGIPVGKKLAMLELDFTRRGITA